MGMHIKYVVTAVFLLSISLVRRMNSAALNEQLFSVSLSPYCSTCSLMPCVLCAIQTKFWGQNYFLRLLWCSSLKYLCKRSSSQTWILFHAITVSKYQNCGTEKIDSGLYANLRLLRPCILCHVLSILWYYRGTAMALFHVLGCQALIANEQRVTSNQLSKAWYKWLD